MKNFLNILSALLLLSFSASQASAQIKDGEATVMQGSTVTVSIGAAYQSTLSRATSISYTWTAGNTAISIQSKTNKTCTIKGNTPGTAKLNYHCSYYIDGYYRTMDFYYDITIKSNTIQVTRIDMTSPTDTLVVGQTFQVTATAYPTNATNRTLKWTSDNNSVATVSSSGLVTATGPGKVWIRALATDGSGSANHIVINVKDPEQHWLTVILPNGSFSINATALDKVDVKITPDAGFTVHSVTLDGVEQDIDVDETQLTLPALTKNATLNVVFASSDGDLADIGEISDAVDTLHLSVSGSTVSVSGMHPGDLISVYNLNGERVLSTSHSSFALDSGGVYIVRIAARTFKIAI